MTLIKILSELKYRGNIFFFTGTTKLIRYTRRNTNNRHAILLIPSVPYAGSMGDQAMLVATIDALNKKGLRDVAVLTESPGADWSIPSYVKIEKRGKVGKYEFLDTVFLRFLRLCWLYDECMVFGADVLDGGHGDWGLHGLIMADLSSQAGLQTTVLGCSINKNPSPKAIMLWRKLSRGVRVCLRDPVSKSRLDTLTQSTLVQAADIAFLLEPDSDSGIVKSYRDWCEIQREKGHDIIAINTSAHFFTRLREHKPDLHSIDEYLDWMARIIEHIKELLPQISLTLISHDNRGGGESDFALNKRLLTKLTKALSVDSYTIPEQATAAQIKAIVAFPTVVVTARMHLAIASLGQSTPCLCFAYQGKFEGLLVSFGISELCMLPEVIAKMSEREIALKVLEIIEVSSEMRKKITNRLSTINALSATNLVHPANEYLKTV